MGHGVRIGPHGKVQHLKGPFKEKLYKKTASESRGVEMGNNRV